MISICVNAVSAASVRLSAQGGRDPESPFVFTSQRAARLTEAGIHHWFRRLKAQAIQGRMGVDLRHHL